MAHRGETHTVDAAPPPSAYVVVVDSDTAWRFPVPTGETIVGRAEEANLRLRHGSVSRRHARLVRAGETVTVHDLGSHNGVTVNGVRVVAARALVTGDVLAVGQVALVFRGPNAAPATGSPGPSTELVLGETRVCVADPVMRRIYDLLARLAPGDLPVLLQGETGTGKELAALQLHHASPRSGAFVAINCAALPEALVESELFGYRKGAFSGASATKLGRIEAAEGGTLFLDEIGDMPLGTQAKILRVLETRRITRLGDVDERPVNVRVVAATHRDLEAESLAGRFRQDLYFRLCGASVWIPPLRERRTELALLAEAFLVHARERAGRPGAEMSPAVQHALASHGWPGNVRELKQVIEYAAVTATGDRIELEHLPERMLRGANPKSSSPPASATAKTTPPAASLEVELRALERERMKDALSASGGNQSKAAAAIGMPRRTFVTKMKVYGLGK